MVNNCLHGARAAGNWGAVRLLAGGAVTAVRRAVAAGRRTRSFTHNPPRLQSQAAQRVAPSRHPQLFSGLFPAVSRSRLRRHVRERRPSTEQAPVSFDDIAVYFSESEWGCLCEDQKTLYKDVMKDNYQMILSLSRPDIILNIELGQEPYVRSGPSASNHGEHPDNRLQGTGQQQETPRKDLGFTSGDLRQEAGMEAKSDTGVDGGRSVRRQSRYPRVNPFRWVKKDKRTKHGGRRRRHESRSGHKENRGHVTTETDEDVPEAADAEDVPEAADAEVITQVPRVVLTEGQPSESQSSVSVCEKHSQTDSPVEHLHGKTENCAVEIQPPTDHKGPPDKPGVPSVQSQRDDGQTDNNMGNTDSVSGEHNVSCDRSDASLQAVGDKSVLLSHSQGPGTTGETVNHKRESANKRVLQTEDPKSPAGGSSDPRGQSVSDFPTSNESAETRHQRSEQVRAQRPAGGKNSSGESLSGMQSPGPRQDTDTKETPPKHTALTSYPDTPKAEKHRDKHVRFNEVVTMFIIKPLKGTGRPNEEDEGTKHQRKSRVRSSNSDEELGRKTSVSSPQKPSLSKLCQSNMEDIVKSSRCADKRKAGGENHITWKRTRTSVKQLKDYKKPATERLQAGKETVTSPVGTSDLLNGAEKHTGGGLRCKADADQTEHLSQVGTENSKAAWQVECAGANAASKEVSGHADEPRVRASVTQARETSAEHAVTKTEAASPRRLPHPEITQNGAHGGRAKLCAHRKDLRRPTALCRKCGVSRECGHICTPAEKDSGGLEMPAEKPIQESPGAEMLRKSAPSGETKQMADEEDEKPQQRTPSARTHRAGVGNVTGSTPDPVTPPEVHDERKFNLCSKCGAHTDSISEKSPRRTSCRCKRDSKTTSQKGRASEAAHRKDGPPDSPAGKHHIINSKPATSAHEPATRTASPNGHVRKSHNKQQKCTKTGETAPKNTVKNAKNLNGSGEKLQAENPPEARASPRKATRCKAEPETAGENGADNTPGPPSAPGPRKASGNKPSEPGNLFKKSRANPKEGHRKKRVKLKGPFKCNECGKLFTRNFTLLMHRRIHTGEKPFACQQCGKKFREHNGLKCHMRCHTKEKPYLCLECGKRFSQHLSLVIHQRTHTDERPFECKECGKSFSDRSTFLRHQLIHTGEKPHSCSYCGKSFSQLAHVRRHEKIHTGERPYGCAVCGKRFIDRPKLSKHEQIHKREPK